MHVGTWGIEASGLRPVGMPRAGTAAGSLAPPAKPVGPWQVVGSVQDERIDELSGVVASRRQPGVLWVHNDSGDGPRVFAIDASGATHAEVTVDGARAIDWEDIAVGPGPVGGKPGEWLYVADTGDNLHIRRHVSIYRFPEPSLASGRAELRAHAERIDVRYGDDAHHNVEAMLVDPVSGDVVLVTKVPGNATAQLFRVTQGQLAKGDAVAELVGEVVTGPLVTGGDVRADGGEIVLRTYRGAWRFSREPGESLQAALARAGTRIDAPDASEAIAYESDGRSIVSIPEGRRAFISRLTLAR